MQFDILILVQCQYQNINEKMMEAKDFYAGAILCFRHYCHTLIVAAWMMETWKCRMGPFYVSIILFWYFDTGTSIKVSENDWNIAILGWGHSVFIMMILILWYGYSYSNNYDQFKYRSQHDGNISFWATFQKHHHKQAWRIALLRSRGLDLSTWRCCSKKLWRSRKFHDLQLPCGSSCLEAFRNTTRCRQQKLGRFQNRTGVWFTTASGHRFFWRAWNKLAMITHGSTAALQWPTWKGTSTSLGPNWLPTMLTRLGKLSRQGLWNHSLILFVVFLPCTMSEIWNHLILGPPADCDFGVRGLVDKAGFGRAPEESSEGLLGQTEGGE